MEVVVREGLGNEKKRGSLPLDLNWQGAIVRDTFRISRSKRRCEMTNDMGSERIEGQSTLCIYRRAIALSAHLSVCKPEVVIQILATAGKVMEW